MWRGWLVIPLALALLSVTTASAESQKRALIIANVAYDVPLGGALPPETRRGAELLRDTLSRIGFEVSYVENRDLAGLKSAIVGYASALNGLGDQGIGFFYYSGHGAARADGTNYLIPLSAESNDPFPGSLSVQELIATLHQGAPKASHVVVVDACRDQLKTDAGRVKAHALYDGSTLPENFLLAHSTMAGALSAGDDVYAAALANGIARSNVHASLVFGQVKLDLAGKVDSKGRPYRPDHRSELKKKVVLSTEIATEGVHDLLLQPSGKNRIVFEREAIPVYAYPDTNRGLLEIKGKGAVHRAVNDLEIHHLRDQSGTSNWLAFMTLWGMGFVQADSVRLDHAAGQ